MNQDLKSMYQVPSWRLQVDARVFRGSQEEAFNTKMTEASNLASTAAASKIGECTILINPENKSLMSVTPNLYDKWEGLEPVGTLRNGAKVYLDKDVLKGTYFFVAKNKSVFLKIDGLNIDGLNI